jgi:lysophospholipase L1-like esterase
MRRVFDRILGPAFALALAAQLGLVLPAQAQEATDPAIAAACATTPAPRTKEYPWMSVAQWNQTYADQLAQARHGGIDLMFVGDSITAGWPRAQFERNFGRWHPANFSIGGDHTGNVLYRLADPRMLALHPRAIVLMIGVNNFWHCGSSTEQTFAGVQAVVAMLRRQYPDARILLSGVLPYGEPEEPGKRTQVRDLNRLVATLADGHKVVYRDYGPRLLLADGSVSRALMPDYLHPNAEGYRIWAKAMAPDIDMLMR